jgi:L-glutamine:2-deoxy-scyllo-inosose/3-amino-2,3-dideoxy-scyllo-inosose aminotransferase
MPEMRPLRIPPQQQRVSVFRYAVARDPEAFAGRPTDVVASAVTAELGLPVGPGEGPLDRNIRYRPRSKAAWREVETRQYPGGFPAAHRLAADIMVIHHPALLADRAAMDDIVAAFAKVAEHAGDLPERLEDVR